MLRIDLNADLGEGAGNDEAILGLVTSANVACGVHAGSPSVMARTIELAKQKGVAVGAHPGLADRKGFGRGPLDVGADEVHELVVDQVRTMVAMAGAAGVAIHHVKPHGVLYNAAAVDARVADAVASAVAALDDSLILFGLAGSESIAAGRRAGLRTAAEGFADRNYAADGTLIPRSEPNALIDDSDRAASQAIRLVREGRVRSVDGSDVEVHVDTICIHGDSPEAAALARAIRAGLEAAGIDVRPVNS